MMAAEKQEAPGARQRYEGRFTTTLPSNSIADPFDRLLDRLEGVQHHGKGCRALCPACGGKSRKLSLSQGDDGRVLMHCFAGCSPQDVLAAVGLTVADLFVRRIDSDMTPAQRRELREHAKQSQWRAALDCLQLEIGVVHIAARQLAAGQSLNPDDLQRMNVAVDRIRDARSVLNVRY
jgi:hypothetical protein